MSYVLMSYVLMSYILMSYVLMSYVLMSYVLMSYVLMSYVLTKNYNRCLFPRSSVGVSHRASALQWEALSESGN